MAGRSSRPGRRRPRRSPRVVGDVERRERPASLEAPVELGQDRSQPVHRVADLVDRDRRPAVEHPAQARRRTPAARRLREPREHARHEERRGAPEALAASSTSSAANPPRTIWGRPIRRKGNDPIGPVPCMSCWAVTKRSSSPKPGPYRPERKSASLTGCGLPVAVGDRNAEELAARGHPGVEMQGGVGILGHRLQCPPVGQRGVVVVDERVAGQARGQLAAREDGLDAGRVEHGLRLGGRRSGVDGDAHRPDPLHGEVRLERREAVAVPHADPPPGQPAPCEGAGEAVRAPGDLVAGPARAREVEQERAGAARPGAAPPRWPRPRPASGGGQPLPQHRRCILAPPRTVGSSSTTTTRAAARGRPARRSAARISWPARAGRRAGLEQHGGDDVLPPGSPIPTTPQFATVGWRSTALSTRCGYTTPPGVWMVSPARSA